MATNKWMCESCKYIGSPDDFPVLGDEQGCKKCGSADVFPHRIFRCLDCKVEGDQVHFFGPLAQNGSDGERKDPKTKQWVPVYAIESDADPTEGHWERVCGNENRSGKACGSTKWEQIA